jgi:hypothetical protein
MALWANLGPKLATTRSIPEAYEVYGKCVSQQMKMSTEDTQHLLNDLQQMTRTAKSCLAAPPRLG